MYRKSYRKCSTLINYTPELAQNTTVKYQHIIGNLIEMKAAVKLIAIVCEKREELIDNLQ